MEMKPLFKGLLEKFHHEMLLGNEPDRRSFAIERGAGNAVECEGLHFAGDFRGNLKFGIGDAYR